MHKIFKYIAAILVVLITVGCSTQPGEKEVDYIYKIEASKDINSNINGDPSPVLVRVFQLSNNLNFDNATYDTLFDDKSSGLGGELISVNEYLINPNTNTPIELQVSNNVQYLGVAVGYRLIDSVNWKTIIAAPDNSFFKDSGIIIKIEKLSVNITEL